MSEDGHNLIAWVSVLLATPLLIVGWLAGWTWHWLHISFLAGMYGLDSVKEETQARLVAAQTRKDTAYGQMREALEKFGESMH